MPEASDATAKLPWWLRRPLQAGQGGGMRYLVYCRVYALATVLRLTLPDALQDDWLATSLIHWLGALLLAANGAPLGWLLCAGGLLGPLLFLEDQLSQSGYLLTCAIMALVCFAGDGSHRASRVRRWLPHGVRLVTLLVYALAALHKLNDGFFDPAFSCANAGLGVLVAGVSPGVPPSSGVAALLSSPGWPLLFVAVEISVALLLWWRPAYGVLYAVAFHLPLTIIFAPGFVFTMASGWICFLRERELELLWRTLKRRAVVIVVVGSVPAALSRSAFFAGRWSTDPDWCVKEVVAWLALAWVLETVTIDWRSDGKAAPFRGRAVWDEVDAAPWPMLAVAALFFGNGLTPYLGLQFHHTGAMLSNLRIDRGCHNSLVFPEAMRVVDPYVRLDDVGFAPHRASPLLRASVTERLWGPEALYRARARWCSVHKEPLRVRGSHDGRAFDVRDFCADDGWPLAAPWLPGTRRFQVNLLRRCPQACVH
jgi:hypothetical protein